jgi:hypothetical protein
METASVATPTLSGNHVPVSMSVTVQRCCLIYLALGAFPTNKQGRRFTVAVNMDLALEEVATAS